MSEAAIMAKLKALREVLPAQGELSAAGVRLYARTIADIPLDAIDHAISRAVHVCEFFPTPAKLRELAGVARPDDAAVHAWGIAHAAISSHGAYRSVVFDDPVINATVRHMGGWDKFCAMTDDDAVFRRREFAAAYAAFARSGITPEQAEPLPGLHERSGKSVPAARIGSGRRMDPARAAIAAGVKSPRLAAPSNDAGAKDRRADIAAIVGSLGAKP